MKKSIGQPYVNQRDVAVAVADTPYTVIETLSETEIALGYGDIVERWRRADLPNVSLSPYRIVVDGVAYRFAGQIKKGK